MTKLIIVSLVVATLGCGGSTGGDGTTPAQPENKEELVEVQQRKLSGSYACSLEIGGSTSDGRCIITKDGNSFRLQMSGSKPSISGTVEATDSGFRVTGEMACDGEGCPQPVDTEFFDQGDGSYNGVFASDAGIVNATMRK